MMNQNSNLNLARKWRSKDFNEIIGQEIPIRTIKNSIYLKKLFPVYLFAGQRGCGKTSTARIFAAAINCQNLESFQKDPSKNPVPCLKCASCMAMAKGNHPDFIEIDAASHTGVENVRQILESCSYMPVFGSKKIYLIDEAHMLSKAAFNAFLKILEEPPKSALFILATTESQKFPQTVLSRCFQVIFKAIDDSSLKAHLKNICNHEQINIEDRALDLIIQESEGSARDAINLLERIRFSKESITLESLLHVLGKISEKELLEIFNTLLDQNPRKLLENLKSISFEALDSQNLWNMLVQLCRTLIWIKFETKTLPTYFSDKTTLEILANKCSINRLNAILQLLWSQEEIFLKTPQKSIFLETVLLQICQQENIADLQELIDLYKENKENRRQETCPKVTTPIITPKEKPQINRATATPPSPATQKAKPQSNSSEWQLFLNKVAQLDDALLKTILNQATFIGPDKEKKVINIALSNNSNFFKDKLKESRSIWNSAFSEVFAQYTDFNLVQQENKTVGTPPATTQANPQETKKAPPLYQIKQPSYNNSNYLSITNEQDWPKASLLTKFFPGKIKKL